MSIFPTQVISYRLANGALIATDNFGSIRGITADNETVLLETGDSRFVNNDPNVPTDHNSGIDDFLVNIATGSTTLVDRTANGVQFHDDAFARAVTPSGQYVLLNENASVSGFLYRKDTQNGDLDIVAKDLNGNPVKAITSTMSADGRFVIWSSFAHNITPDSPNSGTHIYFTDVDAGTTRLLSKLPDGTLLTDGNTTSGGFNLTLDNRYAFFTLDRSIAFTDPKDGIYRVDLTNFDVLHLPAGLFNLETKKPYVSIDDNIVVAQRIFGSAQQVVAYNVSAGTAVTVSAAKDGTIGNGYSVGPTVSIDGRFVLFNSVATNLGPAVYDTGHGANAGNIYLYLKDLLTGDVVAVEDGSNGGLSPTDDYFFTADGKNVVYQTWDQDNDFIDRIADISSFVDRNVFVGATTINGGDEITLDSDYVTSATLTLKGNPNGAAIAIVAQGGATLEGGGEILLTNTTGGDRPDLAKIVSDGADTGVLLDNFYIEGNGTIGDSHLTLILNDGGVSATNGTLVIDTGANTIFNSGLFSAFAGTLKIYSDVDQTNGGQIVAYTGSEVWLGNVTIKGGALKSYGTGVVESVGNTLLDGTDAGGEGVRVQGDYVINAGYSLEVIGKLVNSGTIEVDGNYYGTGPTKLIVDNYASLTGGGTILLTDTSGQGDATQAILTGDADATVVNVDNTIKGYGLLGDGKIYLQNQSAGSIVASGGKLTIRTDGLDVVNGGLIEARTGAITVAQGIDNTGTVMVDAGYTFTITGSLLGNGVAKIAGTLDVGNTTGGQEFAFTGTSGLLRLHAESGVSSLSGFTVDNRISFVDQSGLTTQVTNGTLKILSSNGTTVASFLLDADEQKLVFSAETIFGGGGTLLTATSASSSSSSLSAGAGQTVSGAIVTSGQTLAVFSGGTGSANTVSSGGTALVYQGGKTTGDTISAGGLLYAFLSGVASGDTLAPGAFAQAYDGGTIAGATVKSNAIVYAGSGGIVSGAVLSIGGYELDYGGVGSGAIVSNGGGDLVGFGGSSVSATISSGGLQELLSGGIASKTIVSSGGVQYILPGGSSISANVDGGTALLYDGFQSATSVGNGGVTYVEGSSGRAVGNVINGGGVEFALYSGTVSGTTVSSGGLQIVGSDSLASGTVLLAGGLEVVQGGGSAIGGTVSGGIEYVLSGGVQSGGIDVANGITVLLDGGKGIATSVGATGILIEQSGGVASGIVVSQGGFDVVAAGGVVSGATLSSGGFLVVQTSGVLSGAIALSGIGNDVILASGAVVSGAKFSDFNLGDYFDLQNIGYTSGVTSLSYANSGTSGTLTVTSGSQSVSLNLLGQYVAANFTLQTDGGGGTLVGDPPVSSGALAHG